MDVKALIKNIRTTNFLTLEALARQMGVSRVAVHNWSTGKTGPQLSNLRKIRDLYPEEFAKHGIVVPEGAND